MRARSFRPILDRLDGRLLLSDASIGTAVVPITQVVLSLGDQTSTGMMPGEEIDGLASWDWVVAGAPPAPTYDPSSPPLDMTTVTSSDVSN